MSMSKPSRFPVVGLRKPKRNVVWSTPTISFPLSLIFVIVDPAEVVLLGDRLASALQLFWVAEPPVWSAPPTCAGCGRSTNPTGAGSTGFPAEPQAGGRSGATK